MPGRNLSLGITWVCDVGPAIRIGCVGLHEPSELKKKSVQFGAANAAAILSAPDAQAIAPKTKQTRRPAAALTFSISSTRCEVRGRRYTARRTGAHDSVQKPASSPRRVAFVDCPYQRSRGLEGGIRIPECDRTGKRPRTCPDCVPVIAALNDPLTILLADDFSDVVTPDDDGSDSRTTGIRPIVGPRSRKIIRGTGVATHLAAHVPPTPGRGTPGVVSVPTCIAQMVMVIRSGFRARRERAKHSRCS
jgi:hypothetical protein